MRTARSEGEKEEYQEEGAEMRNGREACDCDVGARGVVLYSFTVYRRCVVMSFVSEMFLFTRLVALCVHSTSSSGLSFSSLVQCSTRGGGGDITVTAMKFRRS